MIIEVRGSKPQPERLRLTCSCGTIATFEPSEAQGDQREGPYVVCPVCGSFVALASPLVARVVSHASPRLNRGGPTLGV